MSINFYIRAISAIVVVASSSFLGLSFSNRLKNTVKDLKEIIRFLNLFQNEILYTFDSIPNIFIKLARNNNSDFYKYLNKLGQSLKDFKYHSLKEGFLKEFSNSNDFALSREDLESVGNLLSSIEEMDPVGIRRIFELTLDHFEKRLKEEEEKYKKNSKVYISLGISLGLIIVTVFI